MSASARDVGAALLVASDSAPCRVEFGDGRLFVGSIGAARNSQVLRQTGITHVLTVGTDLGEDAAHRDVVYGPVINILDKPSEDLLAALPTALAFIDQALGENHSNRVLVHCFQGKSRSVAVCAAYIISKLPGCTLEQALAMIRSTRPRAQPNLGFCAQLLKFQKQVNK